MTTNLRPFAPCTEEQLRMVRVRAANQRRAWLWLVSLFLEMLAGALLLSAIAAGWVLGMALGASWLLGIAVHAVVLDALLFGALA